MTIGDEAVKINDGHPVEFLTTLTTTTPWLDWADSGVRFNNLTVSIMGLAGGGRREIYARGRICRDKALEGKRGKLFFVEWNRPHPPLRPQFFPSMH